jgi:hypothetical protein
MVAAACVLLEFLGHARPVITLERDGHVGWIQLGQFIPAPTLNGVERRMRHSPHNAVDLALDHLFVIRQADNGELTVLALQCNVPQGNAGNLILGNVAALCLLRRLQHRRDLRRAMG